MGKVLNADQEVALGEILKSYRKGVDHVLIGPAGSGKTTLTQAIVAALLRGPGARIAVTAPTHRAVQEVKNKLREAGIEMDTLDRWTKLARRSEGPGLSAMTLHSYLGLRVDINDAGRQILTKESEGYIDQYHIVIIDECSMVGSILQKHIDEDLGGDHWVLYVGDEAQLPPVLELFAICFNTPNKSKLTKIVRQAENNPILVAATNLRWQQEEGANLDMSWARTDMRDGIGILDLVDDNAEAMRMMEESFKSAAFKANNDAFRVLAHTNEMVKALNALIRFWIYGKTESPFVVGERILCRGPVADRADPSMILINTNEEVIVTSIEKGTARFNFPDLGPDAPRWEEVLPVWVVELRVPKSNRFATCYIAIEETRQEALLERLREEAKASNEKSRWWQRFNIRRVLPDLRPIYAMTIHTSQGCTFGHVFINITDCVRFANKKAPLETQQLLYTAITRPSNVVILIGDVVPYVPAKKKAAPAPRVRSSERADPAGHPPGFFTPNK
jgi:exodeoxyribonuclease-5